MDSMTTILADHNVEGQFGVLARIWTSPDWLDLWLSLVGGTETFASLGLASDLADSELWSLCQERDMVLITGNRNADDDDSLEVTMRKLCQPNSLPVLTIADPNRVMYDREYAERVAVQIIDILMDLDRVRGTRRIYVP